MTTPPLAAIPAEARVAMENERRMTLSDKLSAADGPSRELDREIAEEFGWKLEFVEPSKGISFVPNRYRPKIWVSPNGERTPEVPKFTTSVDTARTLEADGITELEVFWVHSDALPEGAAPIYKCKHVFGDRAYDCTGKTEALARCAAAVKVMEARNLQNEGDD